jgi:polyhydroxyalkanoate synthesis regulator phasin
VYNYQRIANRKEVESMIEELKKLMLVSLGSVALTRERIGEMMDTLVKQGELTKEQGAKVLDALAAKGGKERESLTEKWKELVGEVISKMDLAKKGDLEKLKKRVSKLEKARKEK